jgi:hypothetical protein
MASQLAGYFIIRANVLLPSFYSESGQAAYAYV